MVQAIITKFILKWLNKAQSDVPLKKILQVDKQNYASM